MKNKIFTLAAAVAAFVSIGTVLRTLSYGIGPARDGLYGPAEFALLAGAAAVAMGVAFVASAMPQR